MKKGLFFCLTVPILIFFLWVLSPLKEVVIDPQWIFYDRNGTVLFSEKPYFQPHQKIPDFFQKGLIAIEDQDFFEHGGVDFSSLFRAAKQNLEAQETISGASTITMQLSRAMFLPKEKRTFWYKIRQIFYAIKLESKWSKEKILETYVERINFGSGAIGLDSAANRYFAKNPETLSIGEFALLIGLIPNPSKFNPLSYPQAAEERKKLVLDIWARRGVITKEEQEFWEAHPIKLNVKVEKSIHAPHFVFWAKDQLHPLLKEKTNQAKAIHVHTTVDQKIYSKILNIAQKEIETNKQRNNAHNASSIVIDLEKNEIRAMLGSVNFFDETIDGAVNMSTTKRSTGSTLKPFLYALALEQGASPADEIKDQLKSFPSPDGRYLPRNFDVDQEYGSVRFREALANSYNLSAVNLLQKVGLKNFLEKLSELNLDIGEESDLGLSAILGSGEASLLHLTTAYSVFAHHGELKTPKFITQITIDGQEVDLGDLGSPPWIGGNQQIYTTSTTDWITHTLSDTQIRWQNFSRGNTLEVDHPAAVKTGTSQAFRDNWVIGYSPRYAVGVWVGNARGAPLHTTSGVEGAGPLWNKIFRLLHANLSEKDFEYESERKEIRLCRRPHEQNNCSEEIMAFLLPEEREKSNKTPHQEPTFSIAFPHDRDIFHVDSEILLQTRNAPKKEIQYFVDGTPTSNHLRSIVPGKHQIWAESDGQKSKPIEISVEE